MNHLYKFVHKKIALFFLLRLNKMSKIDVVFSACGRPDTKYCQYNLDIHYSTFSVAKFLPWVRYIWIIVPDGWDKPITGEKIKIIKETTIVPKKYLPTHNSNVVESWIWKLQGLSDQFIYMCDDMYIGKPCSPEDFFVNKKPILRLYDGPPNYPPLTNLQNTIPYVRMWANAVEKYGFQYTRIQHQALPLKKSLMKKYYLQYKKEVDTASENITRKGELDFNLMRFTSPLSVMNGESYLLVTRDDTDFFVEGGDFERQKKILKIKPKFFCINNNSMGNKKVYVLLKKYFNKEFS